ncbi:MAG: right-handed parallel beta-helix repeat-containing protein [Planctomycetota bacterium]|jgi:predicted outer membrane repeat protein
MASAIVSSGSGKTPRITAVLLCFLLVLGLGILAPGCSKKKKDKTYIPPAGTGTGPGTGTNPGGFKVVVANFMAAPTHGIGSVMAQFTDLSTGGVTSWAWDFDCNGTIDSTLQHPMHTYSTVGVYTVCLTVSGPDGSDTATKVTYIQVANNIRTVNLAGGGDFTTIQDAVDASSDGDLILVANGTYVGTGNKDIHFDGKRICLKSENGPANCIIDCEGSGRGFDFQISGETLESVIDGFTIQNADPGAEGGAIYLYASDATISNCIIKNNAANGGAGICARGSESFISNCIFENNTSSFSGGAIYMRSSSSATVIDTIFRNNTSGGSGGAIGADATLKIYRSVFDGNTASGRGGAIAQWHAGGGTLIDCWVKNNSAGTEGGGLSFDHTSLSSTSHKIERCFITNNTAATEGGGIYFRDQARPLVVNTVIAYNSADNGGGIASTFFTRLEKMVNCVIACNQAINGGGIYIEDQPDFIFNVDNTIIWANIATGEGNQISVTSTDKTALNYCDYQNDAGDVAGSGSIAITECINSNPLFANMAENDFHLLLGSPCFEKGSNSLVPAGITTDLDGDDRIVGTVEIGTYEE